MRSIDQDIFYTIIILCIILQFKLTDIGHLKFIVHVELIKY